jgi:hypothetical protein
VGSTVDMHLRHRFRNHNPDHPRDVPRAGLLPGLSVGAPTRHLTTPSLGNRGSSHSSFSVPLAFDFVYVPFSIIHLVSSTSIRGVLPLGSQTRTCLITISFRFNVLLVTVRLLHQLDAISRLGDRCFPSRSLFCFYCPARESSISPLFVLPLSSQSETFR